MIGGGYYTITGTWDWQVILTSLPYALGVCSVIFGKHIDKREADRGKGIHTLPVLLDERVSRYVVMAMLALPAFFRVQPMFRQEKPDVKPADFPDVWSNYYVAAAFYHNRVFGMWFLLGLAIDAALQVWVLA